MTLSHSTEDLNAAPNPPAANVISYFSPNTFAHFPDQRREVRTVFLREPVTRIPLHRRILPIHIDAVRPGLHQDLFRGYRELPPPFGSGEHVRTGLASAPPAYRKEYLQSGMVFLQRYQPGDAGDVMIAVEYQTVPLEP